MVNKNFMIIMKWTGTGETEEEDMNGARAASAGLSGEAKRESSRLQTLKRLDKFLWFCWFGFPGILALVYWRVTTLIPQAMVEAGAQNCLQPLGHPNYISLHGKAIFWSGFLFQNAIFFIVLWVLHRMVRRFISGRIFVEDTLAGLKSLGVILIVWPFLAAAARYAENTALSALGDLPPKWPAPVGVQLGYVAMGLFLLALKIVIEYAIEIKSDQELTI
jgi:Protein of unknown function (DUF2975)